MDKSDANGSGKASFAPHFMTLTDSPTVLHDNVEEKTAEEEAVSVISEDNSTDFSQEDSIDPPRQKKRKKIKQVPKGKKKKNQASWIDYAAKLARQLGTEGTSRQFGEDGKRKVITPPEIGPGCKATSHNCHQKCNESNREFARSKFYAGDQVHKWNFLNNFVSELPTTPNDGSSQQSNNGNQIKKYAYSLPTNSGENVKVCRIFFLHTLGENKHDL